MWILPKTKPLSVFVPDMVESKEDLQKLELIVEQSLMWKLKPSPWLTWLKRWKRGGWIRHLFLRTLKHSRQNSFAAEYAESLPVIRANRLALPVGATEPPILGICGHTFTNISKQLNLFGCSLKTSGDMSKTDCARCLKIWKTEVTERNGEYLARQRLAPPTGGQGFLFWPTPTASDWKGSAKKVIRKDGKDRRRDRLDYATEQTSGTPGRLNPEWVGWLMGLPTGSTDLGCWGTE